MCFQLMDALVTENYFGNVFRNSIHDEIKKIIIPSNKEELLKLVKEISKNDNPIRINLFFGPQNNFYQTMKDYIK